MSGGPFSCELGMYGHCRFSPHPSPLPRGEGDSTAGGFVQFDGSGNGPRRRTVAAPFPLTLTPPQGEGTARSARAESLRVWIAEPEVS
jgi:hypothetical protein